MIITLLQEKGGTGKTTLATHIAAGLAIRGYRVLLVDADGQGHATRMFGAPLEAGLYNLLVRGAGWEEVLRTINPDRYAPKPDTVKGILALLPGNPETMLIPLAINDSYRLHHRLSELRNEFDVMVIDTSPTPSLLNGSILFASNGIIYPTQAEYFSLKALEESIKHTRDFGQMQDQQGFRAVKLLGIIPTMVRANTVEHQENLKLMAAQDVPLWPVMPLRITWPEAAMQRKSIFVYDPHSAAASELWQIVANVETAIAEYVVPISEA